ELGQHAEQRPGADRHSADAGGLPWAADLPDRGRLQSAGRPLAAAGRSGGGEQTLVDKEKPPRGARRRESAGAVLGPGDVGLIYGQTISTRRFCGSRTPSAVGTRWSI